MGGKKKQTVGYRYFTGMHLSLCHGPIDKITKIKYGDKVAWQGESTGGQINIDAYELHGGDSGEGGIQGRVDVLMGEPTQARNDYLLRILGDTISAYRGVVSLVCRQLYWGTSPYIKPLSVTAQRIYKAQDGAEQWYPAKAGIGQFTDANRFKALPFGSRNWQDVAIDGMKCFAAEYNGYIYKSPDGGETFSAMSGAGVRTWLSICTAAGGLIGYAGTTHGKIYKTTTGWESVTQYSIGDSAMIVSSVACSSSGEKVLAVASGYYPKFSADFGATWSNLVGFDNYNWSDCAISENGLNVALSRQFYPIILNGAAVPILSGSEPQWVCLAVSDAGVVFSARAFSYIYKSSGGKMVPLPSSGARSWESIACTADGNTIVATSSPGYVYLSTDGGATWEQQFVVSAGTREYISCDVSSTGSIVAGAQGGECFVQIPPPPVDMNPAHIIRECISNSDGGMGYTDADIDDASFTAAANTLYAEGFGLSFLWEQDGQIEEFVRDVQTHIDARVYVHPRTGKWTLKLIREDYDANTLPVLGPEQIRYVEDYARPQFGELSNSVSVTYWDSTTQQDAGLSVDDPAMIQMQGAVIQASYDYPGVTNAGLAARLAQRDLRAVSSQLLSATIYCNRSAASLLPGDPFKFDWPQLHAEPIICRVGKIELGSPDKGEVKITLVEDVFALASTGIVRDDGSGWQDPAAVQIGHSTALLLEAPYYELVQRYGESRTNAMITDTPEVGMLLLTGSRATGAINAIGYVGGEEMRERVDFSPSGLLAAACGYDELAVSITWAGDVPPATGSHIQVGDECMRFDGLDSNGLSLVGRGVIDTVPAAHAYESPCWGWDAFAVTDEVERAEGENVSAQIMPRGTSAVGPLSAAVDIDFAARAVRPYAPGKLRINGAAYPDAIIGQLVVGWAHRDRLLQTASLVDTEQASIGPEVGTTYTLRIYGDGGVLVKTASGLTGTSYTYSDETGPLANTQLRVELESLRDGWASWQKHDYAFERAGYGYNYGKFYGGV